MFWKFVFVKYVIYEVRASLNVLSCLFYQESPCSIPDSIKNDI